MSQNLEERIQQAISNPRNLGELENADSVGTVGSADCGDMLRMWVKFKDDAQGRKVIDRATFQTFGCETALAVASVATELIAGKTVDEALSMSGSELSAPLGALPPMKIHCAQLVERALHSALVPSSTAGTQPGAGAQEKPAQATGSQSGDLVGSLTAQPARKVKFIPKQ